MLRIRKSVAAAAAAFFIGHPIAAPAADLLDCIPAALTCAGAEPIWSFSLTSNGVLTFSEPQRQTPMVVPACATPSGVNIDLATGGVLALTGTISPASCPTGTGQMQPRSITITFRQGSGATVTANGCCL